MLWSSATSSAFVFGFGIFNPHSTAGTICSTVEKSLLNSFSALIILTVLMHQYSRASVTEKEERRERPDMWPFMSLQ